MWDSIACSDAKSLPLFQQFACDYPAYGDDVYPLSAIRYPLSAIRCRCDRSRICCPNMASTSATRRYGSGGTGLVRCLQRRSGSVVRTRTGAGTWTKCSCGSMGRRTICGVPLIMKAKCSRFSPEARDEALWSAGFDRHGQASVIPRSDECDR